MKEIFDSTRSGLGRRRRSEPSSTGPVKSSQTAQKSRAGPRDIGRVAARLERGFKKALNLLRKGGSNPVSCHELVEAERVSFSVPLVTCRGLGLSRSGYYPRRNRPPRRGAGRMPPSHGRPARFTSASAIPMALRGACWIEAHRNSSWRKRVARPMQEAGLRGRLRGGRRRNTTRRSERAVPAEDLLGEELRRFEYGQALGGHHLHPYGRRPFPVLGLRPECS
jgi:hypothetical protein